MYEPRRQFRPFHLRSKRWACIVAHRRAGKTVACINELLTRALATNKKSARFAYIAPFYKQAKNIAWDYLKQYGEGVISKSNESELYVELCNGARVYLFGSDNPDALRGLYLDGVVLDEPADMRPSFWPMIVRPMLSDRKGWAVFIGTPKGYNEFYTISETAKADEAWFQMVLRASESGLLDPEELADARKQMTEDQYEQEFECSFSAALIGAVYGKWINQAEKDGRICDAVYDETLPVHTAWDLGFDDATSMWWWQVTGGEVRLIDYYEANGEDIAHYCQVIKDKPYKYGKHYVPHDAANKLLAAGGRSIVQQAYELGVKMFVVPATTQQNSIEAARKTLEASWFCREKTVEGISTLRYYQFEFDEDKKVFKHKPRHDWTSHGADAFEIIGQVWRNPPEEKVKPRPKFLHDMTANDLFWPKQGNARHKERI